MQTLDLGQQAPDFTLSDAGGAAHRMRDHLTRKGLVIAFICNHCPYVQAIAERLAHDTATLIEEGVGVLAIMPNDYQTYRDDAPPLMRRFADQHGFAFPYLVDEEQAVVKAYGAVCTPEFFGIAGDGTLRYRGRLDDQRMGSTNRTSAELVAAMRMIAKTGAGPENQTAAMGCSIKWRH